MMKKDCIKKMVIGYFTLNNNINGSIVLTSETKPSLLGKDKVFITIKEGSENVSIVDRIKSILVPYYFVNRQTIIVVELGQENKFDNLFGK